MMQSEINIAIGDKAPGRYFSELLRHSANGRAAYGAISDPDEMRLNFEAHCVPSGVEGMTVEHYDDFLNDRRKLMAIKIRDYYLSL
jgi:hypothetical protein